MDGLVGRGRIDELKEERDRYHARYHETQTKLTVHNSEKGLFTRGRERLFG